MTNHVNFSLGLGNGAVFAALAMALVVTYRSSGVLNFATGAWPCTGPTPTPCCGSGELLQPIPAYGRHGRSADRWRCCPHC